MQRVTNSRRRAHSGARSTVTACGYQNRSEALRDLARAGIAQVQETADASRAAVAALTYVYDHRQRELAKRLTRSFHNRHDLSVASMQVHLDHDSCFEVACFEVAVLKGATRDARDFARRVIAERHGRLVTVPVEFEYQKYAHGVEPSRQYLHVHVGEAR